MKKTLAFGLALLLVVLALTLHRPATGPHPAPVSEAAGASSQEDPSSQQARRLTYRVNSATQPSQVIGASLVAAVEAESDPDGRTEALERCVQSVFDADLPTVLDALESDHTPAVTELRQLLIRRWAESDAPTAASWTAQLPEGPARHAALDQVAIAWANTDLPAAVAWVQAMPAGDSKEVATLGLGYEAARSEPVTALSVATALPPGPQRDDLLIHAISQWATGDAALAADWAAKVSDASLRERLLAAVAVASAEKDGAAAAALAVNGLVAGEEQDRTAVSIVQRWAQNSPSTAASWVAQWPDSPARDAATQHLLALWTGQDSPAAAAWLQELPEGSMRAIGFSAYSQALADRDQNSAVAPATHPADKRNDSPTVP